MNFVEVHVAFCNPKCEVAWLEWALVSSNNIRTTHYSVFARLLGEIDICLVIFKNEPTIESCELILLRLCVYVCSVYGMMAVCSMVYWGWRGDFFVIIIIPIRVQHSTTVVHGTHLYYYSSSEAKPERAKERGRRTNVLSMLVWPSSASSPWRMGIKPHHEYISMLFVDDDDDNNNNDDYYWYVLLWCGYHGWLRSWSWRCWRGFVFWSSRKMSPIFVVSIASIV